MIWGGMLIGVLAPFWLLCGLRAVLLQDAYFRRRGADANVAWYGILLMLVLGPIALIGCIIAYPKD